MSDELGTMLKSSDLEGRVFGDYELLKLVGKGGMAWVYKAIHKKFQEPLAVKILLPHLSTDEDIRQRFLDEAKIQFKLRHNHIVQVSDIIEEGHIYGFVMEWAEGKNLKQVLKEMEQPASRKDIWRILGPILDAVGYAHHQGLVHRDIKPANILLHQENNSITPKMADFGIAKALDEEEGKTATGMTMGTLKFMPPEQIRDAKRVDHRADVYALGVTLYMMSTLRLPFEGRQEFVIYQQMNEDPPPPSKHNTRLPPSFDRVAMRALARTPEERFQSCAEFGHALSLALIDPDNIKDDPGDLDTNKIYNMLANLPEENSIYQTALTPLSPILVKDLYSSHTNDTITKLQKFVLEGDPEFDTRVKKAAGANVPEVTLSTEEMAGDTMLAGQGDINLGVDQGGGGLSPTLIGIIFVLLMAAGGGTGWYFAMGPGASKNPPDVRNNAGTAVKKECQSGITRPCYSGPKATRGKGSCRSGVQSCVDGKWGACKGQRLPAKEECNGKDDNCDGKVDESYAKKSKACSLKEGDCNLAGTWQCSKGKVSCEATEDAAKGKLARLRISPGGAYQIRYGRKKRRIGRAFCISLEKSYSVRVRLSRKGYYTCAFRVNRRKPSYRLKMKKVNPNQLDPSPRYCTR